ncbi:hypothetical protein CTA1_8140 [Colletotrichum tanaceti]|uniref:Uncharacterized protein n=1 Tax=Colletotrichum tanaceti TaxID=1306861 RepID=A0A4U6XAD6_9PEZI|nr:hypothetical protein CTA1_8140 [Colletotrichum tanaceti]
MFDRELAHDVSYVIMRDSDMEAIAREHFTTLNSTAEEYTVTPDQDISQLWPRYQAEWSFQVIENLFFPRKITEVHARRVWRKDSWSTPETRFTLDKTPSATALHPFLEPLETKKRERWVLKTGRQNEENGVGALRGLAIARGQTEAATKHRATLKRLKEEKLERERLEKEEVQIEERKIKRLESEIRRRESEKSRLEWERHEKERREEERHEKEKLEQKEYEEAKSDARLGKGRLEGLQRYVELSRNKEVNARRMLERANRRQEVRAIEKIEKELEKLGKETLELERQEKEMSNWERVARERLERLVREGLERDLREGHRAPDNWREGFRNPDDAEDSDPDWIEKEFHAEWEELLKENEVEDEDEDEDK